MSTMGTLLEKAASDNGFDLILPSLAGWLSFGSSHAPLRIWLSAEGAERIVLAFSDNKVVFELSQLCSPYDGALPQGAGAALVVSEIKDVYPLLKRAFQLSRSLPNEPLAEFTKETQALPRTTEVERLVVQRVGQEIFRNRLIDYWDGKCAVTGLAIAELLRASHIKPWADCSSDEERLDVFNGLLLAPHLDAVFDRGLISFTANGSIIVSNLLSAESFAKLGLDASWKSEKLTDAHEGYLKWHRSKVFRGEVVGR